VQAFLKYAYEHWQQPPRYVVLAGNGTYDYKNVKQFDDNMLPAQMIGTPKGLFASDQVLADVNGDDRPDVSIGRLPAVTNDELAKLVEQIKVFESGSGNWQQKALMSSGAPLYVGERNNFVSDSQKVASILPDYLSIDFLDESTGHTNLDLVNSLNDGYLFMNYIGHGGDATLSNNWFTMADLTLLNNTERRPILTALTCLVGNFAWPGYDFLGESLLKWENGGAIAVWAPSGLSINENAVWLNQAYARQIAKHAGSSVRLGDLILPALQEYHQRYGDTMLVGLYNLLGDPALVVPLGQ
jgi:hypothetical protein